jgi:hypothetical protein
MGVQDDVGLGSVWINVVQGGVSQTSGACSIERNGRVLQQGMCIDAGSRETWADRCPGHVEYHVVTAIVVLSKYSLLEAVGHTQTRAPAAEQRQHATRQLPSPTFDIL